MFVWTVSKVKNFEHKFDQNVVLGWKDRPGRSPEGRPGRKGWPVRSPAGRLGRKDRPGMPSEGRAER